jgi:hypothetical protein
MRKTGAAGDSFCRQRMKLKTVEGTRRQVLFLSYWLTHDILIRVDLCYVIFLKGFGIQYM